MNIESLIGESGFIKRMRREIPKLAKLQSHILLKGERGTGKAILAKLIHNMSLSKGSILTITPLAMTEIEIKGLSERLDKEVTRILIQDIEEFSFLSQATISTAIQKLPKKPFVQVIVTTKSSLGELRKQGKILDELVEILQNFETISVPSLNQHMEDIPLLIEHFVKNACEGIGVKLKTIDVNILDFLVRREWQDNIRELKSVVEQAVFMSENKEIELPEYLYDEYALLEGMVKCIKARKAFKFDKSLLNLEKTLLERTLDVAGYNQSKAAEILRLSEANLRYRLKKFKIYKPTKID